MSPGREATSDECPTGLAVAAGRRREWLAMNERSIFLAVLDIPDAADRAAYLDRASAADAALRDRVAELLRAHTASGVFMNRPAAGATITGPDLAAELVGTRVGPYKLLKPIGEGGFGVVYMAKQTEPVRRKVVTIAVIPSGDEATLTADGWAIRWIKSPVVASISRTVPSRPEESTRPS